MPAIIPEIMPANMPMIKLNGKEYAVRYPLNSIRALERETGKSVFQIFNTLAGGEGVGFDLMILVIWAGLLHVNRLITPETAGLWLEDAKDLTALFNTCAAVFMESVQSHLPANPDEPAPGTEAEEKN
jgi:hypothetical protein